MSTSSLQESHLLLSPSHLSSHTPSHSLASKRPPYDPALRTHSHPDLSSLPELRERGVRLGHETPLTPTYCWFSSIRRRNDGPTISRKRNITNPIERSLATLYDCNSLASSLSLVQYFLVPVHCISHRLLRVHLTSPAGATGDSLRHLATCDYTTACTAQTADPRFSFQPK